MSRAPWLNRRVELLAPAQIDDLAERAQAGDGAALEALVFQVGRLALKATRRAWRLSPELREDLTEGAFGVALSESLRTWRRGAGSSFSSWTFLRLRTESDRERVRAVGLPQSYIGSSTSPRPLVTVPLGAPVSTSGRTLSETVAADQPDVDQVVVERLEVAWLRRSVAQLPRDHRLVMEARLAGGGLPQAAKALGDCTRQWAHLLELQARRWLRALYLGEPLPRLTPSKSEQRDARRVALEAHPNGITAAELGAIVGEGRDASRKWLKQHAVGRHGRYFARDARETV